MKILITGGAGFIGCNFVRYMLNSNKEVEIINYDKLTYAGSLDNIKDLMENPRHSFVQADICDKKKVEENIEDVDQIINFAAESHVDHSINSPEIFTKTNICGTQTLLEVARKRDIPFLQISTDEVYGDSDEKFKEESSLQPSNPYSASKAGAEMLVMSYNRTYGLKTLITRTTNNIGPYQFYEKLVPQVIILALLEKEIEIHGDGLQKRDFLYVEDNCSAIELVLEEGKNGEIYNIGADNEKSVIETVKTIVEKIGKDKKLITHGKNRPGQDMRYSLNFDKIRSLGWEPKNNFDNAIEKTINWYLDNRWWWENKVKDYDFKSRQGA